MAEHNENKYAYLRGKPAEELNELLELAVSPEGADEDEAYVDALLAELAAREYTPEGRAAETDRAWRAFQSAYNTEEGRGLSLYPDEPAQQEDNAVPLTASRKKRRLRRALILAAVIACLLALCVPTALGYQGFFDMIGQWTDEQFRFGNIPASSDASEGNARIATRNNGEYKNINDALRAYDITEPVMPTYIPDGFQVQEFGVTDDSANGYLGFYIFYKNEEHPLMVSIAQCNKPQDFIYEKDDSPVELYEKNGIIHYMFQNEGHNLTAWYHNGFECSMGGEIAADELKTMIDSIYES